MPFDNTNAVAEKPLSRDRLRQLAKALRKPMPYDFHWNFGWVCLTGFRLEIYRTPDRTFDGCGAVGCALGLACVIWPDFAAVYANIDTVDNLSDGYITTCMSRHDFERIFLSASTYNSDEDFSVVRPEQVADEIDRYLEKGESQA